MKIICTSTKGSLAYNIILDALNRGHSVIVLDSAEGFPEMKNLQKLGIALNDLNAIERVVLDEFPDAIINCSDIPSSDIDDDNIDFVKSVNVDMPEKLSMLAFHFSSRFIHISSDMVFDGSAAPYLFTDIPSPYNLYGHTKLMAEKKVLKAGAKCSVVLRIPQVIGNSFEQDSSLDEKLFLEMANSNKLSLPTNDVRMTAASKNIASLVVELCERASVTGIHHFAATQALSQYDIAKAICKEFKLDVDEFIEPYELESALDFSLDCTDLVPKVKTRPYDFEYAVETLQVPDSCRDWYYKKTEIKTIKRFKLD